MNDEKQDQLTGDALDARAAELDITGRSQMSADQKREAIARAEEGDTSVQGGDNGEDVQPATPGSPTPDDEERAENVREAFDEDQRDPEASGVASAEQNADLEHTQGGATTRDDATDQGVPMLQGDPSEPVGPEDAAGRGPKRGEYDSPPRVLPSLSAHEAVRVDGGTGDAGPLVTNEDGGIERLPHTQLESQVPRFADRGDEPGQKGGVDTDPR